MTQRSTIALLIEFANQAPGLDFADYGDKKAYNKEAKSISADRNDFFELAAYTTLIVPDFDDKLTAKLKNSSGRLTMKDGVIEYCTGQYFPTEYRPAACKALADLIWDFYREQTKDGAPLYKDGNEIRKRIRKDLSRRVGLNYFN